ncbi:hypothetical protein ABV23_RS02515 [Escherichia coli]|nr:hypothetical protein [Escherichia coli]USL83506.1 hypothetical protein A4_430 [Escherichia phage A4]
MKNNHSSDLLYYKVLSECLTDILYRESNTLRAKYINKRVRYKSSYDGMNVYGKITNVYVDDDFTLNIIVDNCIDISIDDIIEVI